MRDRVVPHGACGLRRRHKAPRGLRYVPTMRRNSIIAQLVVSLYPFGNVLSAGGVIAMSNRELAGEGFVWPTQIHGPARHGRPPRDAAAAWRKALLAAAFDEFSQHGFAGSCLERIARKAGDGRASVYRQYGEKAGLFRAAARIRAAESAEQLRQVVRAGPASRQRLWQLVGVNLPPLPPRACWAARGC